MYQVIVDMSNYEVGVFNKIVREKVRSGEDWDNELGISAEFENVLYYDVVNAASIEEVETAESYAELEDVADWVSCCGDILDHDVPLCPSCKEWC